MRMNNHLAAAETKTFGVSRVQEEYEYSALQELCVKLLVKNLVSGNKLFHSWVVKLRSASSVLKQKYHGRPWIVTTAENVTRVKACIEQCPQAFGMETSSHFEVI